MQIKTRDNVGTIHLKKKSLITPVENLTYYQGTATINGMNVSIRAFPRKSVGGEQFLRLSFRPMNLKSAPMETLEMDED